MGKKTHKTKQSSLQIYFRIPWVQHPVKGIQPPGATVPCPHLSAGWGWPTEPLKRPGSDRSTAKTKSKPPHTWQLAILTDYLTDEPKRKSKYGTKNTTSVKKKTQNDKHELVVTLNLEPKSNGLNPVSHRLYKRSSISRKICFWIFFTTTIKILTCLF